MPPFYENGISDLVHDSRIETEFYDGYIQHIIQDTGLSVQERLIRREELWSRQSVLGQGAYGTVYLEQCVEGAEQKLRAVKKIRKFVTPGQRIEYLRELEAVIKFSNVKYAHCFVRSHGWFESDESVFIAMEYLPLGDLQRYLTRPLPEPEAVQITAQVLEGLEFMHKNGFAHRDVKPGNIMVVSAGPEWFVKIADFGISKRRQQDVTTLRTLQRGTFAFAAPESLEFGPETNTSYTFKVDMWSLGAMVYQMLANTLPFHNSGETFKYTYGMILFPLHSLVEHNVSEEGQDFIVKLLSPNPRDRPTATFAMEHAWVSLHLSISSSASRSEGPLKDSESDNTYLTRSEPHPISRPLNSATGPAWESMASKAWSDITTTRAGLLHEDARFDQTPNYSRPPPSSDIVGNEWGFIKEEATAMNVVLEETIIEPSRFIPHNSSSTEDFQEGLEMKRTDLSLVDWPPLPSLPPPPLPPPSPPPPPPLSLSPSLPPFSSFPSRSAIQSRSTDSSLHQNKLDTSLFAIGNTSSAPSLTYRLPPQIRNRSSSLRQAMLDPSSFKLTVNGSSPSIDSGRHLSIPRARGQIIVSDERWTFKEEKLFPKPREFVGGTRRYRAGRGSSAPIDFSSL